MAAVVTWAVRTVLVLLALVVIAVVGVYAATQPMIDRHFVYAPGPRRRPGRGGPDLSGDDGPDLRIAAAYDLPAFTRLLRTGIALDGRPVRPIGLIGENQSGPGLMAQVAREREGFGLSDAEVASLHAYLQARAASMVR